MTIHVERPIPLVFDESDEDTHRGFVELEVVVTLDEGAVSAASLAEGGTPIVLDEGEIEAAEVRWSEEAKHYDPRMDGDPS
jgi:hypothetical protein